MRNMIKYLEEADVEHANKTYKKGTAQECISDFRRQMMVSFESCDDVWPYFHTWRILLIFAP